jgi:DNA-binding transcriptional LysR family regulator
MELRHIRYFLALSEELHFVRAADRCGVSQRKLSAGIRKMEAELGATLIHRKPQLEVSELGHALRPFWHQALRSVDYSVQLAKGCFDGELEPVPLAPAQDAATQDTPVQDASLTDVRLAMEQLVASPLQPRIEQEPVWLAAANDHPDIRSDAIVAHLRDRLLVASCRARSVPFVHERGVSIAPGRGDALVLAHQPPLALGGSRLGVVVATATVMIVAAALFLFGRIS